MNASKFAAAIGLIIILCPIFIVYAASDTTIAQNPFTGGNQNIQFKDDPGSPTPMEAALLPARELVTSLGFKIPGMYVVHRNKRTPLTFFKNENGQNLVDYTVPRVAFNASMSEEVMWNESPNNNNIDVGVSLSGPYPDLEKAEVFKYDKDYNKGAPIFGYETYRQFIPFKEGHEEELGEYYDSETGTTSNIIVPVMNNTSTLNIMLSTGNLYLIEVTAKYGYFHPVTEETLAELTEPLTKAVLLGMENQGLLNKEGNFTSQVTQKSGKPATPINVGKVPGPGDMEKMLTGIIGPGLISIILSALTGINPPIVPTPQGTQGTTSGLPGYPANGEKRTLHGLDGRDKEVEFDGKTGRWIDTESGNIVDIDRFDESQRNAAYNRELGRQEAERMSKGQTTFDKEVQSMLDRQKEQAKMLQNLQQMEKKVLFGSKEAGSLYENRGGPGDIIANIKELKEKLSDSSKFEETRTAYDKVKKVYVDRITGKTMCQRELPTDGKILRDTLSGAADNTFREIATGSSYKAMALRALTSYMTGGASEYGFVTANSLYGMKDYVEGGGDSAFDAFKEQVKQVFIDEVTDRITGKALDAAVSAGNRVVDEVMDQVKGKLKDWKKAAFEGRKTNYMEDLKKSFEKADADSADIISSAKKAAVEDAELSGRIEIFKKGRDAGTKKVSELDSARVKLEQNPNSPEAVAQFNKAVEKVQMDKHAMQQLNAVKGPEGEEIRRAFNKRMAYVYDESLEKSRMRLAKEYGVPVEDVKIVNPTNVKDGTIPDADPMGFAKNKQTTTSGLDNVEYTPKIDEGSISSKKASFDKDVTIRVKQKTINPRTGEAVEGFVDVPKSETKRVYNEEFYKANHRGELPKNPDGSINTESIDEYAKKMDQATTDRLDAEAYGIGDKDLQTSTMDPARGRKLDDVEAVSKTMEYKSNEWANRAEEARDLAKKAAADGDYSKAAELLEESEGFMEESMRQTTKQFDNMVVNRIVKANEAAGFPDVPIVKIPPELQKGIAIMKKVGQPGGLTVAEAEKALEMMKLSPQKVAEMSSSIVESLQKFSK